MRRGPLHSVGDGAPLRARIHLSAAWAGPGDSEPFSAAFFPLARGGIRVRYFPRPVCEGWRAEIFIAAIGRRDLWDDVRTLARS
ncbi:unnamed protein product, partial [Iphiclides podalirius]